MCFLTSKLLAKLCPEAISTTGSFATDMTAETQEKHVLCEVGGGCGLPLGLLVWKAFAGQICLRSEAGYGVILRFELVELGRNLIKYTLREVL